MRDFVESRLRAFTLIELLIVVAIIAILAAIAVPNFLEAQTRGKVSRVKNDFRAVATAMEAYFVDHNSYIEDSDNTINKPAQRGIIRLTTPVGYITSLATDPFQSMVRNVNDDDAAVFYEIGSGSDNAGWSSPIGSDGQIKVNSWLITSVGTDVEPKSQADDTDNNDEWPFTTRCLTYDPTNGTVSNGDIYRAGGDSKTGNYYVNGKLLGDFN